MPCALLVLAPFPDTISSALTTQYATARLCVTRGAVLLIRYVAVDKQQVGRKRHLGNDCVTILFLEEGAGPISPGWFQSNFQKIFLVRSLGLETSTGLLRIGLRPHFLGHMPFINI